jgi:hypothetical protein
MSELQFTNVDLAYRQLKADFLGLESVLIHRFGITLEEARKVIARTAREALIWYEVDRVKAQSAAEMPQSQGVKCPARGSEN